MSTRGEIWVHGNSAVIQFPGGDGLEFTHDRRMKKVDNKPWTDIVGLREGPGIRFLGQARNSNWFHFSIPTPAVFPSLDRADHTKITIDRVSVYYSTPGRDVAVNDVLVFDGDEVRRCRDAAGNLIFPSANSFGDQSHVFNDEVNSWLVDSLILEQGLAHGIGISLEVKFDVEGEVFFKSAAIHFSIG